ncbi:phage tail protein [Lysinibacillus capsici]|uniref:phage tail protein n=1 Tax=Lysinibacillus TaxID=400634 RepID=UPI000CA2A08F|nr:tail fiber protein [Lysinibacillus sp. YS11]AUS85003.1 phage tail protein [Lysinibacillus sp. YS11]
MAEMYMGSIVAWPAPFAPKYWAFCNGQELPIQQNQALFAVLGNRYGGDGKNTFCLPNLNGRVPVGACGNGGMGGTIPQGVTTCNLGQTGGVEKITLSPLNMPQHTHSATTSTSNLTVSNMNVAIPASSQGGGSNSPNNASLAASVDQGMGTADFYTAGTTDTNLKPFSVSGGTVSGNVTTTIAPAGQLAPSALDIRQPFQALNYIICIQGWFPIRE